MHKQPLLKGWLKCISKRRVAQENFVKNFFNCRLGFSCDLTVTRVRDSLLKRPEGFTERNFGGKPHPSGRFVSSAQKMTAPVQPPNPFPDTIPCDQSFHPFFD